MSRQLSQHFHEDEFRCKGQTCGPDGGPCGLAIVSPRLVAALEELRTLSGNRGVLIRWDKDPVTGIYRSGSGYRCRAHNRAVGGVDGSMHTLGMAADIRVIGLTPPEVAKLAEQVLAFSAGGIGIYDGFTHVDVSTKRRARWNNSRRWR